MTATQSWTEKSLEVAGIKTQVFTGGSGAPLIVLHGGEGNQGWTPYHEALSQHFAVHVPSHPGYNGTERPGWVNAVTDVAHFYLGLMEALRLEQASLIGFSLGGWIAAEIAAMCPSKLKGMVLVDAVGVRPRVGEITEVLMVSPQQVQDLVYYDMSKARDFDNLTQEERDVLWRNREMTSRLAWRPYMHNPNLPEYLKLIRVPSLIVWGRHDGIVPLNCGEIYHEVLQGSILHIIEECGHIPQVEKPQELLEVTLDFLSGL